MAEEFLITYAKMISSYPDKIRLERIKLDENFVELIVYADKSDAKKLIGRDGKMVNAIKTLIIGFKAKDPTSYRITVKSLDE